MLLKTQNANNYMPALGQITDEFVQRIRTIRRPHDQEMPADFLNEMYRWTLECESTEFLLETAIVSVGLVRLGRRLL